MRYTNAQKLEVLKAVEELDNMSEVSRRFDVNRRTIYDWIASKDKIQAEAETEEGLVERSEQIIKKMSKALPQNIEEADEYLRVLDEFGTASQRKVKLNARVETLLWGVVEMLEKHPGLALTSPKDLSKIMMDLESVREKLAGEPTIIIQERNRIKEIVLIAVKDLFGQDAVRSLADRIKAMEEAEVEVVDE